MRAAASLVLVRDAGSHGNAGIEVLLVQRGDAGDFPGLHVFPGGLVDAADSDPRLLGASARSHASANELLATDNALPYFIAAVRESLEEVGVLLAAGTHANADREAWQHLLANRENRFADLLEGQQLALDTDALGYLSHWVTPAGLPRRYDTRFLVARMPAGQEVRVDGREAVRAAWLTPADALAAHARNELPLIFPTIRNLEALAAFTSVDALLDHTRTPRKVPVMLPKMVKTPDGVRLLLPDDSGYDAA